ncbi:dimethyladenosine transferase [Achlya hypogyna]|uniref:Dimethyladenosine transferase n=1 Tax=Achlya hypogyna TaxID=1202772 RepID=A0A1V9YQB7_ACHHY|nr:dimethyladenosine transferase [Achlya hypogyna]
MPERKLVVGVVLFPGYATLDAAGPMQFFDQLADVLETVTIARVAGPQYSLPPAGGCGMVAAYSFEDAPVLDVLLLPGGRGCRGLFHDPAYQTFVRHQSTRVQYLLTVCTGSGFLAACGLLDGRRATTNKRAFHEIAQLGDGRVVWVPHARWVVDGNIWTSSGVTAGMDMVCAFLTKLFGAPRLQSVLEIIEYTPATDPADDAFAYLANAQS